MKVIGFNGNEKYTLKLPFTKQEFIGIGYLENKPQQLIIQNIVGLSQSVFLKQYMINLQSLIYFQATFNEIYLKDTNLIQDFIGAISYLVNLQELNIVIGAEQSLGTQGCRQIQKSLQLLKALKKLTLEIQAGNQIDIDGSKEIGLGLEQLPNLQQLNLKIGQSNKIYSDGIISLSLSLQKLLNLQNLHLDIGNNNNVSEKGLCQLGDSLSKLTNLQELTLKIGCLNNIQNEGLIFLSIGISQLQQLRSLDIAILHSNNIQQEGVKGLSECINNLSNLNTLKLHIEDSIDKQMSEYLQKSLGRSIKLEELSLKFKFKNNCCKQSLQSIILGIQELENLQSLSFEIISFSMTNQQQQSVIDTNFQKLSNLTKFQFIINEENELGEQDLTNIIKSLGYLNNLTDLSMSFLSAFKIQGELWGKLGEVLKDKKLLKRLSLKIFRNIIVHFGSQQLIEGISYLQELEFLNLEFGSNNQVRTSGAKLLSEAFGKFPNLKELVLRIDDQNQLNLSGLNYLSEGIKRLKHLNRLVIDINEPNSLIFCSILSQNPSLYPFQEFLFNQKQLQFEILEIYRRGKSEPYILRNLSILSSSSDKVNDKGIDQLLKNINNIGQLDKLKLEFNKQFFTSKESFNQFAISLSYLKSIKSLIIFTHQNEFFSPEFFKQLSISFGKIDQLEELVINVHLSLDPLQNSNQLSKAIQKLQNLKKLHYLAEFYYEKPYLIIQDILDILGSFDQLEDFKFQFQNSPQNQSQKLVNFDSFKLLKRLRKLEILQLPYSIPLEIVENLSDNLMHIITLEHLFIQLRIMNQEYSRIQILQPAIYSLTQLRYLKLDLFFYTQNPKLKILKDIMKKAVRLIEFQF